MVLKIKNILVSMGLSAICLEVPSGLGMFGMWLWQ